MSRYSTVLATMAFSVAILVVTTLATATDYTVGPEAWMLANISDVPWESLNPGDRVLIHWRATPYNEKWVLCRRGTAESPIVVSGVPGPSGQLPIIDGQDAVTRTALNYWNEVRGVIKIGGANTPARHPPRLHPHRKPRHPIGPTALHLHQRGGRRPDLRRQRRLHLRREGRAPDDPQLHPPRLRQRPLHRRRRRPDPGHPHRTQLDLRQRHRGQHLPAQHLHRRHRHHLPVQPLWAGCAPDCGGNNLKDRSAGLVVRYNWIEGGNRQLDLVDAEDSAVLVNHPATRPPSSTATC